MSTEPGWTGNVRLLRVDPALSTSGVQFSLDFIAIRKQGFVSSLSTPQIYQADGNLTVNSLDLELLQPDEKGGTDYAESELNNAWNMDSVSDLTAIYNVDTAILYPYNSLIDEAGISHTGNFFYFKNITGNGDPHYPLLEWEHGIDTTKYLNICFRAWNGNEASNYNSVARIIWHDPQSSFKEGDDIIMFKGAATYCVDMRENIQLEPALPEGSPNPWTSISENGDVVNYLRVDLNENEEEGYYSVLDWVTVRTDHQTDTTYAIPVKADTSLEVSLYYTTSKSTSGGTLIGTLAAGRSSNVYLWDTTNIPEGRYYIYATVSNNGNSHSYLANGRIEVNHTTYTQDTTAPILNCDRPYDNYTFDNNLEIAGYALDLESRIAALEIYADNSYLATITPSSFSYQAWQNYPNKAETEEAKFFEILDGSKLSYGSHTLTIKAFDTAGNSTTCSFSVVREQGTETDTLTDPTPNGSPVNVDTSTETPTPANLTLSLSVIKKKELQFTISGGSSCSTLDLYAASDENFSLNLTKIFSTNGSDTITLTAKKVPKFNKKKRKKKKDSKDGKIYFKVLCNDNSSEGESSAISYNFVKLKNKKKTAKEKKIIKKLSKKLKVKS